VAKELAQDAFLKALLYSGTNIHTVKHFGRHIPAVLRTALDLGPVPEFTGRQCVDCGCRHGLQYDHVDPIAHNGPTEYKNLEARCWTDHEEKTERDRQAGLLGPNARARPPNTS
jgi:5-methylcytosine-specific restriction endonuclease McrA